MIGGFSRSIQNGSVIESCLTSATASANLWNVGGFSGGAVYTGENDTQPKIENCAATGLVYSHAGDRCVPKSGAFIGHNVGIIQHCYAAGTVTVDDPENWPSGGFAGTNDLPTVNESEPSPIALIIIRAKKAGTCVIYVNALNGICGKITVTVK